MRYEAFIRQAISALATTVRFTDDSNNRGLLSAVHRKEKFTSIAE
jgi:hypothetical protein